MKKTNKHLVFCLFIICVQLFTCNNKVYSQEKRYVLIDWFEYQGNDPVFNAFKPSPDQYLNPVLAGFYPDPSICRVGNDYYLVNSSFSYYPGIPIFHSNDLVHWEQLGYVLNRPSQLNLDKLKISEGIFAPTIRYNNGTFYVVCTVVNGIGNFYVTSKNPTGPWSDPVLLPEIDGIDPSFFFDSNGKAYVLNNGSPEGNIALYLGHRAIWIQEFDIETGKLAGPRKIIVNGGTDISKKPIWIEGPHIIQTQGYYYLIAAEGGTEINHSEVVFRSGSVWGPYEVFPGNPILTQRDLNPERINPVTCTGHADFVQTKNGEWWAVFLGCRPYEKNYFNTGRETFMLPVSWNNGWPVITNRAEKISYLVQKPKLPAPQRSGLPTTGNFIWRDDFIDSTLNLNWNFIRTPRKKWYSLTSNPGFFRMELQPVSIASFENPGFIGRRQQHSVFSAVTEVRFKTLNLNETAGLIAFQNEKNYLYLGLKKENDKYAVFVERAGNDSNSGKSLIIASDELSTMEPSEMIYLKIEGSSGKYSFYYALKKDKWSLIKQDVNAANLSTEVAGGFVGAYIGLYASSDHR